MITCTQLVIRSLYQLSMKLYYFRKEIFWTLLIDPKQNTHHHSSPLILYYRSNIILN